MASRNWAALQLTDHPDVANALIRGQGVPRSRLRPGALKRIGEPTYGDNFVLTDEGVLLCEVRLNGNAAVETAVTSDAPTGNEAGRVAASWTDSVATHSLHLRNDQGN